MPRNPTKNLTALYAKRVKKPGKYAFGNGLYLLVANAAHGGLTKRWYWRGTISGSRKEISIGPYPEWSLHESRDMAIEWRKAARSGKNPKLDREKARIEIPTFEASARMCHAEAIASGLSNKNIKSNGLDRLRPMLFQQSEQSSSTK